MCVRPIIHVFYTVYVSECNIIVITWLQHPDMIKGSPNYQSTKSHICAKLVEVMGSL